MYSNYICCSNIILQILTLNFSAQLRTISWEQINTFWEGCYRLDISMQSQMLDTSTILFLDHMVCARPCPGRKRLSALLPWGVLMLKMIINNDENEDLGNEKIVLTLITPPMHSISKSSLLSKNINDWSVYLSSLHALQVTSYQSSALSPLWITKLTLAPPLWWGWWW